MNRKPDPKQGIGVLTEAAKSSACFTIEGTPDSVAKDSWLLKKKQEGAHLITLKCQHTQDTQVKHPLHPEFNQSRLQRPNK